MKPSITKVYNLIILDESGSMESIKQGTIDGFNELMQSIKHSMKENPEISQYVNFFSFNGAGIKEQLPLSNAENLRYLSDARYKPDHMTPLYDAIGYSVNKLRGALEKETGYSVLVTILTDGEENASKEYSFEAIGSLINDLRTKGWVFTYIGANHDVQATAISLNINNHLHFQATEEETKLMFEKNTSSRQRYMNRIKTGKVDLQSGYFQDEEE